MPIGFQDVPFFKDLQPRTFELLNRLARKRHFEEGECLHQPGDPRDRIRLIVSGYVDITRPVEAGRMRGRLTIGAGDMLGEATLINLRSHPTRGEASSPVEVLEIERDALLEELDKDVEVRAELLAAIQGHLLRRLDSLAPVVSTEAFQLTSGDTRTEHDLIGEFEVPVAAYYGVHTARATENFQITGTPISHYPDLIVALAIVKLAAARANRDCGSLEPEIYAAIEAACDEIMHGKFHHQFVVDIIQGGAGTSTNMNANEVIANRALEHLGKRKGQYESCHPNNHVNASQSTNDAYPTALKIAMLRCDGRLQQEIQKLILAFRAKAEEFRDFIKIGRTQLQDAVPMTLGQEFESWARTLEGETEALRVGRKALLEVNMGGTAIGTGLTAPKGYAKACVAHLQEITGYDLRLSEDLIEATPNTQSFVIYSSLLKSLAIKMSKIANDLRLLASGPRAGFAEINLPARQAGSSIMPGKVNPVIPEVVNQVCFRVIANDLAVTMGAEGGQLQLNPFEPIIAASNLQSVSILIQASHTLRRNCITGITADRERLKETVEHNIGLVTALLPILKYEACTKLAGDALASGKGIVELIRERDLLTEEQIAEVMSPDNMTGRPPMPPPESPAP